jgi:CheY-like chemotaxis protein
LDLNGAVNDVATLLGRLIGEDIELDIHLDRALGRVRADASQIQQIIMNLAVNARDAMPYGGKLTIATANLDVDHEHAQSRFLDKAGPYVVMTVSDTGVGMDKELQSHIFEPFFTTKGPGKGTGLGLAIVYGAVKQNDGGLWLDSSPGRGTTFKIYLPREAVRTEAAPAARAIRPGVSTGEGTILLVEDEDAVRDVVHRYLEEIGYNVLAARTPAEAMAVYQRCGQTVHLLLTDVIMPGMSGCDLARHCQRPGLKVLYMSGYTDRAVTQIESTGKEVAFLQKPFALNELACTLSKLLDAPAN